MTLNIGDVLISKRTKILIRISKVWEFPESIEYDCLSTAKPNNLIGSMSMQQIIYYQYVKIPETELTRILFS